MAHKKMYIEIPSQMVLGQHLEATRKRKGMTRKQLGKIVKVPEQQIEKYEHGAFVPMAMLDNLAKAMDERIEKKLIRKISAARKRETEAMEEQETLSALYDEAFFVEEDE